MVTSKNVTHFNNCLKKIQKLVTEKDEEKEPQKIVLNKEQTDLLNQYFDQSIEYNELPLEVQMYCVLKSLETKKWYARPATES